MSSPEGRFRIPGGSLDLDSDEDHEDGTVQLEVNLLPSPEPPPQIQSIAHLTPAELSCVLSRIAHPLASMTAEYVGALNISGNAFRNLDFSALKVLANLDPAMAEQLGRVQSGVLPCAPPPGSPLQEHDNASTLRNEPSLPDGNNIPVHPTLTLSGKPILSDIPVTHSTPPSSPNSIESAAPVSKMFSLPSSSGEKLSGDAVDPPAGQESPTDPGVCAVAPTVNTLSPGNNEQNISPTPLRQEDTQAAPTVDDDRTDHSGSAETMRGSGDAVNPPTRSAEQPTATASGEQVTDTGLSEAPNEIPDAALPNNGSSTSPLDPSPRSASAPLAATSETQMVSTANPFPTASAPDALPLYAGTLSSDAHTAGPDSGISGPQRSSESQHNAAGDCEASKSRATGVDVPQCDAPLAAVSTDGNSSGDLPSPGEQAVATGDSSAGGDTAMDSDGGMSQAGASPTVPEAATGHAGPAESNQGSVTAGFAGSESHTSESRLGRNGASKPKGPRDPNHATPIHQSVDGISSNAFNENFVFAETSSGLFTPNPGLMSFPPSQRELDTPASDVSTSYSILDTPATTGPGHVNDSSFLESDLLQFSPFSFTAQLAHHEEMPFTELFKVSTYSLGADAQASGVSIAGASCEEETESEIEPSSAGSFESAPCLSDTAPDCTSTPLSYTTGSHGAAAALGGEGISRPLHENDGDGDISPASSRNEAILNQHEGRTDLNLKDVDSLHNAESEDDIEKSSSACEDQSLAPGSLAGPNPPSPAGSRSSCVDSEVPMDFNGPLEPIPVAEVDPEVPSSPLHSSGGAVQLPASAAGSNLPILKDSPNMESASETCVPQICVRPPRLGLTIPISSTTLEEELTQLSPLFSPIGSYEQQPSSTTECSAFERLFSERSFSAARTVVKTPVKLKRGPRMRRVARDSRGTDTSDLELASPATERVLVDVSVQTDEDVEVENLRRRIKALERELRSLRGVLRRSEDRVRESKPKSFWKKVASTDRIVPTPEPVSLGLLKDISWNFSSPGQGNSETATTGTSVS